MDFLNLGMRWIASLWRGLPVVGKVALVLAVPLAGIGAGYLGRPGADRAEVYLFGGGEFTANDLARMEAAFGKARLTSARFDDQRVAVPREQRDLYLSALVDQQALPENFYSAHERALSRDNPFTSQRQRDSWMKLAREQEVALIVRKIKGIEEVCVQYEDTETDEFPRRKRRRATVAVRAVEGRPVEPETVQAIRSTVMTAVGALQPTDVTVLDLNAGRAYNGGENDAVRQAETDYSTAKRKYEEFYQTKIAQRLTMYPGAVVAVNVELERSADDPAPYASFAPRHVAASISLPRSVLVDAWRRSRPEFGPVSSRRPELFELRRFEDETKRQIQAAVAPLLPESMDQTASLITVDTFLDGELASQPAATPQPGWPRTMVGQEWLIALAIAAFGLVAWHASRRQSTVNRRRTQVARRHVGRTAPKVAAEPGELADGEHRTGLRDQLADRVKEDPQGAAAAIKQWLSNVA